MMRARTALGCVLSAVADADGAIPELAGNDGAVVNGRVAARAVNVLPPAP